ncbi:Transcription factor TFIIIC, tau55-related protein [Metarhizium album ARSEF 1941]|uniref:Transcription factor TFIIIC, tau55-related protein n=1 Tax=Metarhizium album (strain ARSEF 1941) TaxID=1081103 RepID=A0A0B2WRI6_METAS|nr:Transcription factor TFIIIC, tau55-related protein [Metarhizium album ARSEF 1941]KHN96633.1 Transcription factor TFIIIC, tau55-related protein [Metarhizium album ARSEF 1941]
MERPKGAFTPNEPGALSLDQVLAQVTNDDQEEWEYEYSATETETFYLTVELSYPEFRERSARVHQHSRGGYYKNWAEKTPFHDTHTQPPQETNPATGDNSDNDDVTAEQDYEDDGTPLDPALLALSEGKAEATARPPLNTQKPKEAGTPRTEDQLEQEEPLQIEDMQILDLHTPNPLFSYRGRLFQGHWAEVIGTEVILTSTSSPNLATLPSLRTLPGDISLLAASSSRIMTSEKIPRPKIPSVDTLAPIKEECKIRIPIGKDRTGERAEQANFLENLIALKIKRGDKDEVTVHATDGQGKDWDDRKTVDYRPRRKKIGQEPDVGKQKNKGPGRRPKGRPSLATRLERYPTELGEGATKRLELSTATPPTWEDLDKQHADEGASEEDGEDVPMTG